MKKVGIVGCGSIAKVHSWAVRQMGDADLVAFADVDITRAQNFSKEYTDGRARAYQSLSDMLYSEELDVVHICTPHYLHVPQIMECLQKGVSAFSEKPPAIDMEQFSKLEEAAAMSDARVGFCFQNRYNRTVKKAQELIESGELGELLGARAFLTWKRDADYYLTDWKGKLSTEGGGALINQAIHTLDLLLLFLGEPTEVKSSLAKHHLGDAVEVEDTVEALLNFRGGKRACFYASTAYCTDAPVILELQCERGSITLGDQEVTVSGQGRRPEHICLEEPEGIGKGCWGSGHLKCINDFYEKCDCNESFANDIAGVKNTMKTMTGIYSVR